MTTQSDQPWYHQGLQFTCSGCGDCCSGSPGYVWVSAEEIAIMATAINHSVEDFEKIYIRKIGARKSLKELPNYDCVFLHEETRKCELYDARPTQCKTWPFWDSNLRTPADWERTCGECPGSGSGKLYALDSIQEQRLAKKI